MELNDGAFLLIRRRLITNIVAVFLFVSAAANAANEPGRNTELLFVQVVFRHGDRYPTRPVRNHTDESYALDTLGQLTHLGMQQMYEFGEYLRYHYAALRLNLEANAVEMTAWSSDVDRAINSASCLLAALYRPDEVHQRFSQSLEWVPVPVHSPASPADNFLRLNVPCPTYIAALENLHSNQSWKEGIGQEEKNILAEIKKEFGPNTTLEDAIDTLLVEREHNLSFTNTSEKIMSRQMKNWIAMYMEWHKLPEYGRLMGGPILSKLVDNVNTRVNKTDPRRKMALFSTHDHVVMALMSALRTPLEVAPLPMSSAVFVELHVNGSDPNVHYVKVLLRNDTERDPYEMTLPNCTVLCPLDEFLKLTRPMIPVDRTLECNPDIYDKPAPTNWAASLFVVAMTALLVALISFLLYQHHRRGKEEITEQYQIVR